MSVEGSLFGLAYGDALGAPTEFLTVQAIQERYGPDGPADIGTGRVTDDTQMALAVGHALREAPALTPDVLEPLLRKHFVAWAMSPDNNRAPGRTCLTACADLAEGLPWTQATVPGSKGCGANMRTTPVGFMHRFRPEVAQVQAALTHGHPTALAASELTAYTVHVLLDGAPLANVPGILRERCTSQRDIYHGEWLGDLWQRPGATTPEDFIARGWDECAEALARLDTAPYDRTTDPCLATGEGWIAEEALVTALYCALLYPDDPVHALRRAAVTSGDSDSIACLAGAFLGAAYGMAAWPAEWAARIEYADQLATLAQSVGPDD
jgi:ADP-ribosylglycohydrolase